MVGYEKGGDSSSVTMAMATSLVFAMIFGYRCLRHRCDCHGLRFPTSPDDIAHELWLGGKCHLGGRMWDAWNEMQLGLCTFAGMLVFLWYSVEGRLFFVTSRPLGVDAPP